MIYLLYGENVLAALEKVKAFEKRFRREVPHAWRLINFEDDGADEQFPANIEASLFAKKDYYIIKHATQADEESTRQLKDLIGRWEGDDSVVVFFERDRPAKSKLFDVIKKASKHEEFAISDDQKTKSIARDDRDLFLLGDLWGRRERKRLIWQYDTMIHAGFSADDILRTFLWHVKNLFQARVGKTAEMKPYVAQKAAQQARNFTAEQLEKGYQELVFMSDFRAKERLELKLLHFFLTR
jgi:hypothetical protein